MEEQHFKAAEIGKPLEEKEVKPVVRPAETPAKQPESPVKNPEPALMAGSELRRQAIERTRERCDLLNIRFREDRMRLGMSAEEEMLLASTAQCKIGDWRTVERDTLARLYETQQAG